MPKPKRPRKSLEVSDQAGRTLSRQEQRDVNKTLKSQGVNDLSSLNNYWPMAEYNLIANRRLHGMLHPDNLTGRLSHKINKIVEGFMLGTEIPRMAAEIGGPKNMRVLEIGAHSGRLAEHLIRKFGLKPENYTIGDIDYPIDDRQIGPRLVKQPFLWVKQGKMKKVHVNLLTQPPKSVGKVHLILVPNVDGSPTTIKSLIHLYSPLLEPGGKIIVNRISRFYSISEEYAKEGIELRFFPQYQGTLHIIKTK
ncbi:MAG: class I SAM-dependent methyltransferase [archaeon]|nr:class I SAM-dependent methyltransferase [archaeon]